jgi:hypothetical protein
LGNHLEDAHSTAAGKLLFLIRYRLEVYDFDRLSFLCIVTLFVGKSRKTEFLLLMIRVSSRNSHTQFHVHVDLVGS